MKILLITNSYPPEIRSVSHLMRDLALELGQRGHQVSVLTAFPRHHLLDSTTPDVPMGVSVENGVRVLRASDPPVMKGLFSPHTGKRRYFRRGIAELIMPVMFGLLAKKQVETCDLVWVFSPPLPLALLGGWCKKQFNSRFLLNVHDMFPQNGIDLGIIQSPGIIRGYELLEKRAYGAADLIVVHSPGNRDFLMDQKHIPASKLMVQYNWLDVRGFDIKERTGRFRQRFGIAEDAFVVLFGGTLGPSQGLETVLDMAGRIQHDKTVIFLLAGDGSEMPRLKTEARNRGLDNVLFKPLVSEADYPCLLKEADAGLVCLSSRVKTPVVPAKIQGYMAAGCPVIGILNKESDGHRLIRAARAGITLEAGDLEKAVETVLTLKNNPILRAEMGKAGKAYALEHFEKTACVGRILERLEGIMNGS
jgi:glycosyltransferase involved in cell wall biosynthesis